MTAVNLIPSRAPTTAVPPLNARAPTQHRHLDGAGIAISVVCLLHCLALPLIAMALPAGDWFSPAADRQIHWLLLAVAAPVSAAALVTGALRTASYRFLALGAVGLGLMLLGVLRVFGQPSEEPLTIIGVVLLACAHIGNWMRQHRPGHAH